MLHPVSSLESARKDIVLHLSSKEGLSSDCEWYNCCRMSRNTFLAALANQNELQVVYVQDSLLGCIRGQNTSIGCRHQRAFPSDSWLMLVG